jgi:sorting nexin-4
MAVIDQDNFSNISWNSEQGTGPVDPSPATQSAPSTGPTNGRQRLGMEEVSQQQDPGHSEEILECTVSKPQKENDGTKDAYVSYLITTNVSFTLATGLSMFLASS